MPCNHFDEVENRPDCLFEVSWEVCNKVGGIHTVISTKALTMTELLGEGYIVIGPDVHREGGNPEFEEDLNMLKDWKKAVYNSGIRIRIGRWKVKGNPMAILVDFSQFFSQKDEVLKSLWETYKVDSISGQWDYVEPVLFGYAAGKVIESYVEHHCNTSDRVVAHFHEWMTSSGGLYLRNFNPYVATVFTTHATVMGRCIAGNGLPLYSQLDKLNADDMARQFGVVAKHSLEKTAANNYDVFLTVSDITAKECKYLLGRDVDGVTPNGFEDDFVWKGPEYDDKRRDARKLMIEVAEACLGHEFKVDPLIVGTSGRYEFRNKGLDVFMRSLRQLAESDHEGREVLAYILFPAGNDGPRKDLAAHMADPMQPIDRNAYPHTTHILSEPEWDPVVRSMDNTILTKPESRVKVIFVPTYLQGDDGIFNKHYYELLVGMDITVFASYYEPWGYTPLESVAFHIPTITTTLAGFGLWVDQRTPEHKGIDVIVRTDANDDQVVSDIASAIERYRTMDPDRYGEYCDSAYEISKTALWDNLITYYCIAYSNAIDSMYARQHSFSRQVETPIEQINFVRQQLISNTPTWTRMMVEKSLPESLKPLETMSYNLWWAWNLDARQLFKNINENLWEECDRNPIALLNRIGYKHIQRLENDSEFLGRLDEIYNRFLAYMREKKEAKGPRIAYFSMEYGLTNSLKIYSGGLGILAGDYLKESSDKNVPMTAVGLLYRYGYFTQRLSSTGVQEASYEAQNFHKLPISPLRDDNGNWRSIDIAFPGRTVNVRIWKCAVGRTDLYLLDTDHGSNLDEDRSITHYLYGGDWENRLKQEIVLGVGGIRTLNALGITSDVYHCNEGHAAFISLERINNLMRQNKLLFGEALEVVRSSSLFTTHTPVPAGHDAFPESMIRQYMSHYPDRMGITWEQFINLGKTNPHDSTERFSMSVLACNMSQEVNGVSWLHGEVSKEILGNLWPGYFKDELHIGYVTNGVHFPTWTASNLRDLYLKYFPEGFTHHQYDIQAWQKVYDIPDEELWRERMALKCKLVSRMIGNPTEFMSNSPKQLVKILDNFKPDVLTIGFARRFATYKRANLLFTNLDRLAAIVNNPERPVQFVFAGKAHPNDKPGQDLIKRIVEVAAMPQFAGKIVFLQNYEMNIARRLVQGVDVWLNTPTRTLEASGTSGEKAVMNGVLQFSVLDGWWVEGYKQGAGWKLPMEDTYEDPAFQNELDAEMIYTTIEEQIAPMYYNRDGDNIPHQWLQAIKKCVADIAANFTTNRMLTDYEERYYHKLYARSMAIRENNYAMARDIAAWKRKVSNSWDKVQVVCVHQLDMSRENIVIGHSYPIEVDVNINGLSPEDIGVELIVSNQIAPGGEVKIVEKKELEIVRIEGTIVHYAVDARPTNTGTYDLALRVYPKNDKLPYRMDFALVKWA